MLSDVLSESADRMQYYLTHPTFRSIYEGPIRQEAEEILSRMEALRIKLDTPPELASSAACRREVR
jgi:hypothetical protein